MGSPGRGHLERVPLDMSPGEVLWSGSPGGFIWRAIPGMGPREGHPWKGFRGMLQGVPRRGVLWYPLGEPGRVYPLETVPGVVL
jgi:hypothetical protein